MACNHEKMRCTNNRFYCVLCGQELPNPYQVDKHPSEKENASEAAKKPVKRGRKKEV